MDFEKILSIIPKDVNITIETIKKSKTSLKLFFNMHELSTFANSNILFFAYSEVGIGMFMNILCIARMLNLLPNTKSIESVL